MTFALKQTGTAPTMHDALERTEPSFGEVYSAGRKAEQIETDSWFYSDRRAVETYRELADRLGDDFVPRPVDYDPSEGARAQLNAQVRAATQEVARRRASDPVGPWADLPATLEEFEQSVTDQLRAEWDDASAVLNAGGWFPETLGRMATGATDESTVLTLPFGAAAGANVTRAVVAEGTASVAAEALLLPRQFRMAERLDLPDPNVALQLGAAAAIGGGLGGALAGVQKAVRYRSARDEADAAQRPEGASVSEFEGGVADAELSFGQEVNTQIQPESQAHALAGDPIVSQALDFIGDLEAPRGYNQVFGGIRAADRPPRPLTKMTVDQVLAWQDSIDPQYNSEAAGRFQIMEDTLRGLKRNLGLRGDELFDQSMQDRLAIELMREQGLDDFLAGRLSARSFGTNLARVWAALPQLAGVDRGRGVYDGFNGNKSLASADRWERVLSRPGTYASSGDLFAADVGFGGYTPTSRGYTGTGQVLVGDELRVNVEYQVVDASSLKQAGGDLQPRDRGRVASDAWVADTAAQLDPARLMPSPTADRGTPLVGPDNQIESGNGRVLAISRAYDRVPDRAAAYRQQIAEAGFTVPKGVERPVLIARRTSDLTDAERRSLVVDAQDSGVARLTATERAQIGQRALTADALSRFSRDARIGDARNRDFARQFAGAFPRSERNAFIGSDGAISTDGIRQIRDSLFARAWSAPDVVARALEGESGDLRSLLDGLDQSAPAIATLRAEIEAGRVRPDMDITDYIIDAVRIIAAARDAAQQGGRVADLIEDMLADIDLLDGAVPDLTQALVRFMAPGGKQISAKKLSSFLDRYADEAIKAGRTGQLLDDALPGPIDILQQIEPRAFRDVGEISGIPRVPDPAPLDPGTLPASAFSDGAQGDSAQLASDIAEAELRDPVIDVPEDTAAIDQELRQLIADNPEIELTDPDGTTLTARALMDDLDQDDVLATVVDLCDFKGGS